MFNTFIKQTEINSGGTIRITVLKQILGPQGQLMAEQPHQITITSDDDFDIVIARNNAHLEQMGYPRIDDDELALPRQYRDIALKDPKVQETIAYWKARQAEIEAAETQAQEA